MTIDLGFGWLTLPNGQEIGIVDVPGHRDFVDNMLAGVAGIDAVLLVVAADEGIMPQTREHLAIIDLLQIPTGVIALTKSDLIDDEAWLDAVETDVRGAVQGTVLQTAPIVRVSARNRVGLDELLASLVEVLGKQPDRPNLGRPRLPIDRVFTMSGFGTVVTGTLSDGPLVVGEEVEFLPSGLRGRVRGLQNHRKKVERAMPGSRTAVNITGLSAEELRRGEVLALAGQYRVTRRVDARLRLLQNASAAVTHNSEVKIFTGTQEAMATLRLLDAEELAPGHQGWIQLEPRHPLVCVRGDCFIVRRPSPPETLGGGVIMDAHPAMRHKRFDAKVLASLNSLAEGNPEDVMFEAAQALGAAPMRDVALRSHLPMESANAALQQLIVRGRLIPLEGGGIDLEGDVLVIPSPAWHELQEKVNRVVSAYHIRFPLRRGIPREELKSQLDLAPRLFNAIVSRLTSENLLIEVGNTVAVSGHSIHFDARQRSAVDSLMRRFAQHPYDPPSIKECRASTDEEIISALIAMGELVPVSADVVFRKADYDSMVARICGMIESRGQIALAEVRDTFGTSRKYAQALLEHLDAVGITRRSGDSRVLAA